MPSWIRMEFPPNPYETRREIAEEEVRRDLLKSIPQLMCNAHEESHDPDRSQEENIGGAIKRMVSLMGRVAIENEKASRQMLWLTWLLAALTVAILLLTLLIWVGAWPATTHL